MVTNLNKKLKYWLNLCRYTSIHYLNRARHVSNLWAFLTVWISMSGYFTRSDLKHKQNIKQNAD